jgi:multisubunit Na+/H+ antiporter MnhB subunit
MTNNFRILPQQNSVNDIIAGAFNAATIALVGVLGIVTLAATI